MSDEITSACDHCPARCCSALRYKFARVILSPQEAERPDLAPLVKWGQEFGRKEQYPYLPLHPKCGFLGSDNRCSIYDKRPQACRVYICHEDPDIRRDMRKFPTHAKLLRKLKLAPVTKKRAKPRPVIKMEDL